MLDPTVHTKLVVLLGHPLGHSLSPRMHNHLFKKLGLDYCYWPVEVKARDLKAVFNGLTRMNLAGFNVTIPHKVRIAELLDTLDPLAAAIGAVNTICIADGRTTGYNTDGEGFIKALETNLKRSVAGRKVVLLGSGGAARAIAMTLAFKGVEKIYIANRTTARAAQLTEAINAHKANCAQVVAFNREALATVIRNSHILVNTTSVGMHPDTKASPVNADLLFPNLAVADIVYNPRDTRLLDDARRTGCTVVEGLGMLVYQGAAAFKLWTGIDPPVNEMFDVLGATPPRP